MLAAGTSKVGTIVDLGGVEKQALARYTQDAGNNVSLEVHPAATAVSPRALRILFVADVVGRARADARSRSGCPGCATSSRADVCVVNGENVADGVGITPKLADRLLEAGADVITLGNHTWRRSEIAPYLRDAERVIRPANMSAERAGPRA